MSEAAEEFTFETELGAPPETVWRALVEPDLRQAWLPEAGEVVAARPPDELTVRCDGDDLVTFTIRPANEGARLTIVHRREAAAPGGLRMAA